MKITIELPDEVAQMLTVLSECQGASRQEVIRKAIIRENYFFWRRRAGSTILVQATDGEIREVIFGD